MKEVLPLEHSITYSHQQQLLVEVHPQALMLNYTQRLMV
jgi:hypothetical protein